MTQQATITNAAREAGQPVRKNTFASSARCDCRNDHNSSSGRCNARNVTDPTRTPADNFAACERCRASCPCGSGSNAAQPGAKPKKGDRVAIYDDPVTTMKFEGNATVLRLEMEGSSDYYPNGPEGEVREVYYAAVRFDGERTTRSRWVCRSDEAKQ